MSMNSKRLELLFEKFGHCQFELIDQSLIRVPKFFKPEKIIQVLDNLQSKYKSSPSLQIIT